MVQHLQCRGTNVTEADPGGRASVPLNLLTYFVCVAVRHSSKCLYLLSRLGGCTPLSLIYRAEKLWEPCSESQLGSVAFLRQVG